MAKSTRYNEVFPELKRHTEDAAAAADKYAGKLTNIVDILEKRLKVTAEGINVTGLENTLSGIMKITTAERESAVIAKELAQARLLQAKADAVINKERDRGAALANKAAAAAQKEASAYKQMSATLTELRNKWKDLAAQNKENTAEGKALLKQVTDLDKQLKKIDATVGQHQRNVGNYKDALGTLPGALGRAANGVQALQAQFLTLLANPIVALIAAIAGALMLLFNAFTRTDSGGAKFAKLMEQVGAILSVLMQRIGMVANGIMLLFEGKYTEAANEFKGAVTGVAEQLEAAADAAGKYKDALEEIEDAEISYISQAAANRKKIAELEFNAADRGLASSERRKALQEAIAIGEEETKRHAGFLKQRYLAEVEYQAGVFNVNKELLRAFIEANDENGKFILDMNADLAKARNDMGDEMQKKLEEMHAATIEEETKFFEENKRNNSKLSALDQEFLKEKQERLKKANEARRKELDQQAEWEYQQNKERLEFLREDDEERAIDQKNYFDKAADQAQQAAEANRELDEMEAKMREEALKAEEEAAQARLDLQHNIAAEILKIEKMIADELEQRTNKKIKEYDREIEASKDRYDMLRQQAIAGNKDAQDSITIEKKRMADLQAEREKVAEKARKQQLYIAAVQGYTAKVQSGDKNAVFSELRDLGILLAGISLLPSFYEGTHDTGNGGSVDDKNGFLSILHPKEKVFNREDASKIGYDVPNSEVADVYNMYKSGLLLNPFDRMSVSPAGVLNGGLNTAEIVSKLDAIEKNTAKNYEAYFDERTKYLIEEIRTVGRIERNTHKGGGLWRV